MKETWKVINAIRNEIDAEKFKTPEQMLEMSRLEMETLDRKK